jgi:beta-lactamase superfamily II metal-dependent hydrolase
VTTSRRGLLLSGLAAGGCWSLGRTPTVLAQEAQTLPPWTPGTLDIHHIDTGVGNATFVLAPDGTTILIDCGATRGGPPASAALRPDESRAAGEWVARYCLRHARPAERTTLDYIIATHVHPDHVGAPLPGDPRDADGVALSGLPQVDALMPARVVIDRGYPNYATLPLIDAPFARNHRAWLQARMARGRRVERVRVGSRSQVAPRGRGGFELRFVAGDGAVWPGQGEGSRAMLADRALWSGGAMPGENHLSIALTLSCGAFRYFAGGDLSADTHDGALPWLDVETPVVRAAGPVDVAAADHHGYFDASGPAFVKALDADVYIVQAWHATHPAMATLQRMEGAWASDSVLRDVFITRLVAESRAVNARFLPGLRSTEGHVVVRVRSDGAYRVFVTDSRTEEDWITHAGAWRRSKHVFRISKMNG